MDDLTTPADIVRRGYDRVSEAYRGESFEYAGSDVRWKARRNDSIFSISDVATVCPFREC